MIMPNAVRLAALAAALTALATLAVVLAAPADAASYVSQGILLPLTSLAFAPPLVGLGVSMPGLGKKAAIAASLALAATLLVTSEWAGSLAETYPAAEVMLARYPIAAALMLMVAGLALMLPSRAKALVALAALVTGIALGPMLWLDGPGDVMSPWHTRAGVATALLMTLASAAAASLVKDQWLRIARPILGSWLVAASILLAAAPFVPRKPPPAAAEVTAPQPNVPPPPSMRDP